MPIQLFLAEVLPGAPNATPQALNNPQAQLLAATSKKPEAGQLSIIPPLCTWRPIYLQPVIQISALCAFFALAVTIEVLQVISVRRDGLATSRENIHYLWTYGPTAILTLIAAAWGRVAFQAQLVIPWYRLMQGPVEAEKSILLDYFDMLSPVAIWKSLRSHDWIVSISLAVGLIIQPVSSISN